MPYSSFYDFINSLESDTQKRLFQGYIQAHIPNSTKLQKPQEIRLAEASSEFKSSLLPQISDNFIRLFTTHTVEFLGGRNSFSFKVTDSEQHSFVLKIENNLKQRVLTDNQLKDNDIFLPVQGRFNYTDNTGQARAFIFTDFLESKDIEQFSSRLNVEERRAFALMVGEQMALFMLSLKEKKLAITDGKNSNFLYDANKKKIQISDFKSIIETTEGLVPMLPPTTRGFHHPEDIKKPTSEDAFQAYMLGRNIYQLLTGCSSDYLQKNRELDYKFEVFQTPNGKHIKDLIGELMKDKPEERLKLTGTLKRLKSLQTAEIQELRKAASDYLTKIQGTSPMPFEDTKMTNYIEENKNAINNGSLDELIKLSQTLKLHYEQLNTKGPRFIKDKIKYFEKRSHKWLTRGGNSIKADLIAKAFMNLDISERVNAHNNLEVRAALDYQRVKAPDVIKPNHAQSFLDLKVLYRKKPCLSKLPDKQEDVNGEKNTAPPPH